MVRLSLSARRTAISMCTAGYKVGEIQKRLEEEDVFTTTRSLYRLIKKFKDTGRYTDLPRRARDKKLSPDMLAIMDNTLKENDEPTASELRGILVHGHPDLEVSISMIKYHRRALGWVSTRPHYCQLIRGLNKTRRLVWCREQLRVGERFGNVIFSDECTIQLEHHGRLCFQKKRKLKSRAKHPAKLHVWGAISSRGAAPIVMFSGIIDAVRYGDILDASLVPFIADRFCDGHRYQMDNDPKH